MGKEKSTVQINMRVTPTMASWLRRRQTRTGVPMATFIKRLIIKEMRRVQEKQNESTTIKR